jgi:hypothetical protein
MAKKRKFFIKKAVKHPGELRRFAEANGCLLANGNIDLSCVSKHIRSRTKGERRTHLLKALNLARTLRRIRPHK